MRGSPDSHIRCAREVVPSRDEGTTGPFDRPRHRCSRWRGAGSRLYSHQVYLSRQSDPGGFSSANRGAAYSWVAPSRTQRIVFGRGDLKAARTSADSLRAFVAEHPPAAIAAQSRARGAMGINVADVSAWRDAGGADQSLPAPLVLLDDEPKGRALRVVDNRTATISRNRKRLTLGIAALGPLAFAARLPSLQAAATSRVPTSPPNCCSRSPCSTRPVCSRG